jgi:hypothetical protein
MARPFSPGISRKLAMPLWLLAILGLTSLTPVQAGIKWSIKGPEGGTVNCFTSPDAQAR